MPEARNFKKQGAGRFSVWSESTYEWCHRCVSFLKGCYTVYFRVGCSFVWNSSNWNFRSRLKLWVMPHLYSSSLRLNLEVSTDSNNCRVKTRLLLACKGLHEKDRFKVFGLSQSLLLPISKSYLEINWIKTLHNWVAGILRQWIIFLWPWNFPGKNTGLGCHFLLQGIFLT